MRFQCVHALPHVSPALIAERTALERADAHDGSWRVYIATLITLTSIVVAFYALTFARHPLASLWQSFDVVGAASTLACLLAAIRCMRVHHRSRDVTNVANACVCIAWLVLVFAMPVLLLGVLVARFGLSA